jgi:xanthine/uracil permease
VTTSHRSRPSLWRTVEVSLLGVLVGAVVGYLAGYGLGTWALRGCEELDCVWVYWWGICGALVGAIVVGTMTVLAIHHRAVGSHRSISDTG